MGGVSNPRNPPAGYDTVDGDNSELAMATRTSYNITYVSRFTPNDDTRILVVRQPIFSSDAQLELEIPIRTLVS